MQDYGGRLQFVGFYWTYPVRSFGFTELSTDPEEAARQSRTIRYQRELAHWYANEHKGVIVDELVFLELSSDHGTKYVMDALTRRAVHYCVHGKATLLWVNFAERGGWRPHRNLHRCIRELQMRHQPVPPLDWEIDNKPLRPEDHFMDWQEREERSWQKRREAIPLALAEAMEQIPAGYGRNPKIAEYLNQKGVRTKTGQIWTPTNVSHAIRDLLMQMRQDVD